MDNRQYRLEKQKLAADSEHRYLELAKDLVSNPIVELAAGTMFLAWLFRDPNGKFEWSNPGDWTRVWTQGISQAGLTGIIAAQQLSKGLPYITDATMKIAPLIGGLIK